MYFKHPSFQKSLPLPACPPPPSATTDNINEDWRFLNSLLMFKKISDAEPLTLTSAASTFDGLGLKESTSAFSSSHEPYTDLPVMPFSTQSRGLVSPYYGSVQLYCQHFCVDVRGIGAYRASSSMIVLNLAKTCHKWNLGKIFKCAYVYTVKSFHLYSLILLFFCLKTLLGLATNIWMVLIFYSVMKAKTSLIHRCWFKVNFVF